jgi:hypothetical protein
MVTDQLRIKSLYAAWHEETRRKQGFVWRSENNDTWIANSKAMIPDSPMSLSFQGIPDAAERGDIIAYLKTQRGRSLFPVRMPVFAATPSHERGDIQMRAIATLSLALAVLAFASPWAFADEQVTPNAMVTALEEAFGVHPGQRRNHAKGTCATGSFVGLPEATSYSRSALFSGATIPVVARLTVGQPGDAETDPTVLWPSDRKEFKAGTVTFTASTPQEGAECKNINYDPLVRSDGIAPTDDPVLLFRSPSYALSFVKRLQGK